jgi:hypothetical protein
VNDVILLHRFEQAKAIGVRIAAMIAAERIGLTPLQCAAVARRASETYRAGGKSPARVVADVHREVRELAQAGAA